MVLSFAIIGSITNTTIKFITKKKKEFEACRSGVYISLQYLSYCEFEKHFFLDTVLKPNFGVDNLPETKSGRNCFHAS